MVLFHRGTIQTTVVLCLCCMLSGCVQTVAAQSDDIAPGTSTVAPTRVGRFGLLPFSIEISDDIRTKMGAFSSISVLQRDWNDLLMSGTAPTRDIVWLSEEEAISFLATDAPEVTIDPVSGATLKGKLEQLSQQRRFEAVIFGHVREDWAEDQLHLVLRVYRSEQKSWRTFEDRIPLAEVTEQKVRNSMDKVARLTRGYLSPGEVTTLLGAEEHKPRDTKTPSLAKKPTPPDVQTALNPQVLPPTPPPASRPSDPQPTSRPATSPSQGRSSGGINDDPPLTYEQIYREIHRLGFPASGRDSRTQISHHVECDVTRVLLPSFDLCYNRRYLSQSDRYIPCPDNTVNNEFYGLQILRTYLDALKEIQRLRNEKRQSDWVMPNIYQLFALLSALPTQEIVVAYYWSSSRADSPPGQWLISVTPSDGLQFVRSTAPYASSAYLIPIRQPPCSRYR